MPQRISRTRGAWTRVWLVSALLSALFAAAAPARAQEAAAPTRIDVVGEIGAPLPAVRAVLLDLEGFRRWFPRLAAWRVLSRDAGSARVYGLQDLPWPVRDRDYVVRYRWWDEPDGSFVLEAVAQAGAAPPAPEGVVREEVLRSEWRIEPAEGGAGTRARYRYEGDAGHALARWIARVAWRAHTRAVVDGLAGEVARRAAPAD